MIVDTLQGTKKRADDLGGVQLIQIKRGFSSTHIPLGTDRAANFPSQSASALSTPILNDVRVTQTLPSVLFTSPFNPFAHLDSPKGSIVRSQEQLTTKGNQDGANQAQFLAKCPQGKIHTKRKDSANV